MNKDIRLLTNFYEHRKTRKLIKERGLEGVVALQKLWIWCAKFQIDGDLSFIDEDELQYAMGTDEDMLSAFISIGFIDDSDGLKLHNWDEHNTYATKAKERSEAAKKAAAAKWAKHGGKQ